MPSSPRMLKPALPSRPVAPFAAPNRVGARRTLTPGSKRTRSLMSEASWSAIWRSVITLTVAGTSSTFCGNRVALTVIVPRGSTITSGSPSCAAAGVARTATQDASADMPARASDRPIRRMRLDKAVSRLFSLLRIVIDATRAKCAAGPGQAYCCEPLAILCGICASCASARSNRTRPCAAAKAGAQTGSPPSRRHKRWNGHPGLRRGESHFRRRSPHISRHPGFGPGSIWRQAWSKRFWPPRCRHNGPDSRPGWRVD